MVIGDGIDVEPAPVDLARVSTSEELPGVEAMSNLQVSLTLRT
jgi:hypothetical protein